MSNKSDPTATMGTDIGKNWFHVVGLDQRGAIVLRQKSSRRQIEARLANLPPCPIGMEACVGAHHLSRKLQSYRHDARLMPPKYARPCSKGRKNDFRDAEAIAEAVQRPTMKFEIRRHQDGRPARFAGAAPGARTAGQPEHQHHQPNSCLPGGTRDCGAPGSALLAHRIAGHPRHPHRGAFVAHY
jgi:hypothetical protein